MKAQIVQQCKDIFRATEPRKPNCKSRLGNAFLTEPRGFFYDRMERPKADGANFLQFFGIWSMGYFCVLLFTSLSPLSRGRFRFPSV